VKISPDHAPRSRAARRATCTSAPGQTPRNEAAAKLYTDIRDLTCRADYGADASAFFNTVTGRSRFQHFEKLSMAPFGLRERLISKINSEAERARKGEERRKPC